MDHKHIMRIGIDARLFHQTGVGSYTRNLLVHLAKLPHDEIQYVVFCFPEDRDHVMAAMPGALVIHTRATWHTLSEQIAFARELWHAKLDLMHFTYFSYPVLYKKPFVITLHDVIPLTHATGKASQLHPFVYRMKQLAVRLVFGNAARYARRILVPTYAVRHQLETLLPAAQGKITVTHEGVDAAFQHAASQEPNNKPIDFLLHVSNFYPHKNVERLVEAYMQAATQKPLVCMGPASVFTQQLQDRYSSLPPKKHIIWALDRPFAERIWYYHHCVALVQPTLTEGFGLPLLEANYFRKPILASKLPVFDELFGEDYYFLDPYNTNQMARVLDRLDTEVLTPSNAVHPFSFADMAKQTQDVYKQLLRI